MSAVENGNGTPPAQGETPTGQELLAKALDTAMVLTSKAAGTQSAAEAKDFAAGVLSLSQVIALLDPSRDTQGIPLGHHVEMQHMKAAQELEKVKEQSRAQASTPAKRTVSVRRDQHGRANSYQVEDS